MKLESLISYKTAFSMTKTLDFAIIIMFSVLLLGGFYISTNKISQIQDRVIVIDKKGDVYGSEMAKSAEMRIFEYENHVRTFYNLWFAFDENSYKSNIEKALFLVGDCGKQMLNDYKDLDVERQLWEKNLKLQVTIKDIKIDLNTNPVSGYIIGTQTIKRLKGEMTRNLNCKFIIYDVDRSRENPHGCKIDEWNIVDKSVLKGEQ